MRIGERWNRFGNLPLLEWDWKRTSACRTGDLLPDDLSTVFSERSNWMEHWLDWHWSQCHEGLMPAKTKERNRITRKIKFPFSALITSMGFWAGTLVCDCCCTGEDCAGLLQMFNSLCIDVNRSFNSFSCFKITSWRASNSAMSPLFDCYKQKTILSRQYKSPATDKRDEIITNLIGSRNEPWEFYSFVALCPDWGF